MTDREKVIKGLETCAGTNNDGDDCTADCLLECPYKGSLCIDRLMYDALAMLKEQPEIVRCKDCVHWIPGTITDKDDFIQPRCKRNGGGWSSDDYCSCAEKRTDEI